MRSRIAILLLALLALGGCGPAAPPVPRVVHWLAGRTQPAFDPDGPPDALRWALERQLSRGLTERDSSGRVHLALADSVAVSPDSLQWTFRLRAGLAFTDGTPLNSAAVAEALRGGLARHDHATRGWVLAAVAGVARVRAGQPLPPLGITTPDARTLVLRLASPDRALLERLSVPGVSTPWKVRRGMWRDAVGSGPWRVLRSPDGQSLTLVAAAPCAGEAATAETLHIRFTPGAPRVLSALRAATPDLVWPLPPELSGRSLPRAYELVRRDAAPERRLLLVLRADVPPTTRVEVRAALVRSVNRDELLTILGAGGSAVRRWLPGASEPYVWARLGPPGGTRRGLRASSTGSPARRESYHVLLSYDAEQSGAEVARALQGRWARAGHYAELEALRGGAATRRALAAGGAQAQLVESQALFAGGAAELALYLLPLRGPAVGSFRTGWRTRAFDPWVSLPEPGPGFDPDGAQRALAEGQVVLPLATLPWQLAIRNGGPRPAVHAAFGPGWTGPESPRGNARSR